MSVSETFIRRPIATSLLMLGVALFGGLAFSQLMRLYLTPVVYTYMASLMKSRYVGPCAVAGSPPAFGT
jgi:hypothetical protein